MKHFSFSLRLAVGVFAASVALLSCQKEAVKEAANLVDGSSVGSDRSPNGLILGVTIYKAGSPSELVQMDQNTGNVNNNLAAFTINNLGVSINLDDLKGICLTRNTRYFLTTGPSATLPANSIYNNALFRVNIQTGECTYISTSNQGTISDLEADATTDDFYGLANNTNAIVRITAASGYTVYNASVAITGIAAGYSLRGLSQVSDANGIYYVGCANAKAGQITKLYTVPVAGGFAGLQTDLDPLIELAGGNCGIGYDININRMIVSRSAQFTGPNFGSNAFGWNPPFGATTTTAFWGGTLFKFEDFTSSVY